MTDKPQDFPEESLEHRLALFNAKERFALIQRVLGVKVVPHAGFLDEILEACNITAKPENVFCAMDFHLDWLYAALMKKSAHRRTPAAGTGRDRPVSGDGKPAGCRLRHVLH
jgi:hypothetical protein